MGGELPFAASSKNGSSGSQLASLNSAYPPRTWTVTVTSELSRSSQPEDRPAVFAAQFALSHACRLVTYPLSGG